MSQEIRPDAVADTGEDKRIASGAETGTVKNEKKDDSFFSISFTGREKKIILVIFIVIAFYFVIEKFDALRSLIGFFFEVIRPVLIGFVFAFLMNPMMNFMEKYLIMLASGKGKKQITAGIRKLIRTVTAILSAVILIGLVVSFFYFIVPQFVEAVRNLLEHLDEKIIGVIDWADEITRYHFTDAMQEAKNSRQIEDWISNAVDWITKTLNIDPDNSENLFMTVTSLGTDLIRILINIIIGLFIAIYVLLSKESYSGYLKRLLYSVLPISRANIFLETVRKGNQIFYGFIIGKLIDSAIIGLICYFSMLIMQMPYPLLCSFVVGVTNIIPIFGPYIGATPTVILIFVTDPPKGIMFLIYILILQQVDGNMIGPKVLGSSTGISSFWVIVAVSVGGSLFGFAGMLIGVPTVALILYIADQITRHLARKKNLPEDPEKFIEVDHIDSESGELLKLDRETANGKNKGISG